MTEIPTTAYEARYRRLLAAGERGAAQDVLNYIRKRSKAKGEAVPSWAQPGPRGRGRGRATRPAPAAPPNPLPPPLELPTELLEWRRGNGRRAVSVAADGSCKLLEGRGPNADKYEAVFPTVAAAAAAVVPALPWRKLGPDLAGLSYLERGRVLRLHERERKAATHDA